MPLVADWATTAALLAVLLAEGVRRLPAGAIVLRRAFGGSWRIVHGPTVGPEWRLVSIWAPISEHLVVQADTPAELLRMDAGGGGEVSGRLPSRLTIAAFRIAGGAILLLIALGVPMTTASHGVAGFARSVTVAFLASTGIVLAAAAYLRRSTGWTAAFTSAAPMLSPFTAPRAAELLQQTSVNRLAASDALEALVPKDHFEQWFRTHAYDELAARSSAGSREADGRLGAIIAAIPAGCSDGDRFCPRCAAVFHSHVEECSDCPSVVLRSRRSVQRATWLLPVTHARDEVGSLGRGRG